MAIAITPSTPNPDLIRVSDLIKSPHEWESFVNLLRWNHKPTLVMSLQGDEIFTVSLARLYYRNNLILYALAF
jgi:hypothetical protein